MQNVLPSAIINGVKESIGTSAVQLTVTPTPITNGITVKVRSLGTGTYIAIGSSTSQEFRLTAVGDSKDIFVDDLSKIYCITDAGNTGALEYDGG